MYAWFAKRDDDIVFQVIEVSGFAVDRVFCIIEIPDLTKERFRRASVEYTFYGQCIVCVYPVAQFI